LDSCYTRKGQNGSGLEASTEQRALQRSVVCEQLLIVRFSQIVQISEPPGWLQRLPEKENSIRTEPPCAVTAVRDIPTSKGFSGRTWGRAYHSNVTKHHEQTEVECAHDSVTLLGRCIVRLGELNENDGERYLLNYLRG
jgi:hypothetical protein